MGIKDWLGRIEEKLDRMDLRSDQRHDRIHDRLNIVDAILVRQNAVLEDHTRRSLANEEAVSILRDELAARNRKNHPKQAQVSVALLGKVAGGATALAAAVTGVLKALGKI